MIGLMVVLSAVLFVNDNAEFFKDVEAKREMNCTFTYVGKQDVRPNVPHIAIDNKHVYFSMEPCPKGE